MRNNSSPFFASPNSAAIGDPESRRIILRPDDSMNGASHLTDPEERRIILRPDDSSKKRPSATANGNQAAIKESPTDGPRAHEYPPPDQQYSGFLIIRLRDQHALADADAIQRLIRDSLKYQRSKRGWLRNLLEPRAEAELDLQGLAALLSSSKGCPRPLIHLGKSQSYSQKRILELEECASKTTMPPLHSLAAYRRVDARHLPEAAAERTVSLLNELAWVDLAYRELAASDPNQTDPFAPHQHYLDRAPIGIGACWAADQMNGMDVNGKRVSVADLEQGWIRHTELWRNEDAFKQSTLHGDNRHQETTNTGTDTYRGDHGTAVVGQLAAEANGNGGVGVAPGCQVYLLSHFLQDIDANGNVAAAIAVAVNHVARREELYPGDVLLLEVQRGFLPTEVDPADFDAIRLATAHGLIVVEAAGNGGFDLDQYRDAAERTVLDRKSGDSRDSGAILVGASRSTHPNDRATFSNYGSRLDCFACGEGVVTTGYGDLLDDPLNNRDYTQTFGGTSSAAPIVAGAAVILQEMHASRTDERLSPSQMRDILSDPATGTPQGPDVPGNIGVMPDLNAIFESLALSPQVYLRAHEGDAGDGLTGNVTCSSPDIEVAQDQVILHARNRGLHGADVEATLYQVPLATMVLPSAEHRIDAEKENVPSGPRSTAISIFGAGAGSEPASYLALLDYGQEPSPTLPPPRPYFRWRDFLSFNRQHAKRSIVEIVETTNPNDSFPFEIVGAPDRPRNFDFEILQSLPLGAKVTLWVPHHLAVRLWSDRLPPTMSPMADHRTSLQLPRTPRLWFPGVLLASEQAYEASFQIVGAAAGSSLVIRQLFEGEEVGRITWRFIE